MISSTIWLLSWFMFLHELQILFLHSSDSSQVEFSEKLILDLVKATYIILW